MTLLRWSIFLLGSLTVTLTVLLYLFLSSDANVCSTKIFHPLGNSDYVFVSTSMGILSNSKRDAPFHHIASDYSCADWDGLCDHSRDVP